MYKVTTVILLIIGSFFVGVLSQKNCVFVQNLMDGKVCRQCVCECCKCENCECNKKCVDCVCKKK